MGHRTFEEIQEDTRRASTINDAEALLCYASELYALDTPQAVAWACSARGWALHLHGDYPAALAHYHRGLALYEELGYHSGIAMTTGNVGLVLVSPGDVDGAVLTLHNALSESQQFGLRPQAADIHKQLRDLALKRNDLAAYVEHNNEYTRITEEINGKDAATKIAMQAKQREIDAKERETQKQLAVLHSTLPKAVAERVARGEVVNDQFENATVIFLDIVGFTEISSSMSSQEVITLLDDVFTQCDSICAKYGVTKIKTIGDSYMCVSFDNVVNAACCAVEMNRIQYTIQNTEFNSAMLQYRIGVHCGPVTAGVIGKERMQYDVWGDTVNVASRMESSGEPGRVHVSEAFALEMKKNTEYTIQNSISESPNPESHAVPLVTQLVTRNSSLVTPLVTRNYPKGFDRSKRQRPHADVLAGATPKPCTSVTSSP